jgi:hypothetical protein
MVLVRQVNKTSYAGNKMDLFQTDVDRDFVLEHLDTVTVPATSSLRPVFFIEGAVVADVTVDTQESTKLTIEFTTGETYGLLIRRNRTWFSAISDTRNAYIIRRNEQIPINLNPLLYDASFRDDLVIQANDTLIVPFRQYFVSVTGAVVTPGRYPYIPDRYWDYYVALAGGFVTQRNTKDAVNITDVNGKELTKEDIITPESIINGKTNSFTYYFNTYAPIVTTVLSLVTTFISIYMLAGR